MSTNAGFGSDPLAIDAESAFISSSPNFLIKKKTVDAEKKAGNKCHILIQHVSLRFSKSGVCFIYISPSIPLSSLYFKPKTLIDS